ncbi:hypothetical protein PHSC3_000610 [Chlamydiales bacterium STE3]|nr:hypothetical protein PHSC3_000610 [Chlamydiales bacterium STE3]
MLKYETSKEKKIAVAYKERTKLFTKDFILALCIAIAIHLSFVLLFRIKEIGLLIKINPKNLVFKVESDLALNEVSIDELPSGNGEEVVPAPMDEGMATLDSTTIFAIEKYNKSPFHYIETPLPCFFLDDLISKNESSKKKEIVLSHELSSKKILNAEILKALGQAGKEASVAFKVQVDDATGRVFWSELYRSSGKRFWDKQAAEIIHQLEFAPLENAFVSLGEIELYFQ